jgi:hypothetical protein
MRPNAFRLDDTLGVPAPTNDFVNSSFARSAQRLGGTVGSGPAEHEAVRRAQRSPPAAFRRRRRRREVKKSFAGNGGGALRFAAPACRCVRPERKQAVSSLRSAPRAWMNSDRRAVSRSRRACRIGSDDGVAAATARRDRASHDARPAPRDASSTGPTKPCSARRSHGALTCGAAPVLNVGP